MTAPGRTDSDSRALHVADRGPGHDAFAVSVDFNKRRRVGQRGNAAVTVTRNGPHRPVFHRHRHQAAVFITRDGGASRNTRGTGRSRWSCRTGASEARRSHWSAAALGSASPFERAKKILLGSDVPLGEPSLESGIAVSAGLAFRAAWTAWAGIARVALGSGLRSVLGATSGESNPCHVVRGDSTTNTPALRGPFSALDCAIRKPRDGWNVRGTGQR